MKTSEQIAALSEAMANAQAVVQNAVKDRQNPHFKAMYADLASVIEASRKPLTDNGIAVVQGPEDGKLVTRVMHKSGEWLEFETPLIVDKGNMQGLGSAITYARRYALMALTGIAADDDDGNAAAAAPPRQPAAAANNAPRPSAEQQRLMNLLKQASEAHLIDMGKTFGRFGVSRVSELKEADVKTLISEMNELLKTSTKEAA